MTATQELRAEQDAKDITKAICGVSHSDMKDVAAKVAGMHRTEQQNVMRFCAAFVQAMANNRTDLRNEASVEFAKSIVSAVPDDKWFFPYI